MKAGYNCGTPDGLAGSKTVEAITAYQTAKGITVNGLVTDELLQSLGVVEKVQETVKEEANKSKNDEEEVDAIFSKFAGCTGVQVGEQIRNVDGSNVALGYVVKFKKIFDIVVSLILIIMARYLFLLRHKMNISQP